MSSICLTHEPFVSEALHNILHFQVQRMWLQLVHCYLLPRVTFHREDFEAVSQAHSHHTQLLNNIDRSLEEVSLKSFKVSDCINQK